MNRYSVGWEEPHYRFLPSSVAEATSSSCAGPPGLKEIFPSPLSLTPQAECGDKRRRLMAMQSHHPRHTVLSPTGRSPRGKGLGSRDTSEDEIKRIRPLARLGYYRVLNHRCTITRLA